MPKVRLIQRCLSDILDVKRPLSSIISSSPGIPWDHRSGVSLWHWWLWMGWPKRKQVTDHFLFLASSRTFTALLYGPCRRKCGMDVC